VKRYIFIIAASLTMAAFSVQGATPGQFPRIIPVNPPALPHNAIGSIPLNDAVFEVTDDGYTNLRLFDDRGREMPYWLRPRTAIKTDVVWFEFSAANVSFKELPGNTADVVVQCHPQDPVPVGIRVSSPVRNYDKQIAISGSDDRQSWTDLAAGPIFDYTRFIDVRNSTVKFTARKYLYYRLTISAINAQKDSPLVQIVRQKGGPGGLTESEAFSFEREPFRIDSVSFLGRREEKRETAVLQRTWTSQTVDVTQDPKRRATLVTFTNPRLPVAAVMLKIADANYSRQIVVEGTRGPDATNWIELAQGTIGALHVGSLVSETTAIDLPQICRHARYRVTIFNQDNPALEVTGAQLRCNEYEMLFFPAGGRRYEVLCGGTSLTPPQYDVAATLARAPERTGDTWSLAAHRDNPAHRPGPAPRTRWFNSRAVLTASLIVMVAVLLIAVARLVKKVDPPSAG